MKTFTLTVGSKKYELSTSLRVAYVLQGMNNHKPYLEIFQNLDKMAIEQQIKFLYAAYSVAAKDAVVVDEDVFINECLDNLTLQEVLGAVQQLISGITGKSIDETVEAATPKN